MQLTTVQLAVEITALYKKERVISNLLNNPNAKHASMLFWNFLNNYGATLASRRILLEHELENRMITE